MQWTRSLRDFVPGPGRCHYVVLDRAGRVAFTRLLQEIDGHGWEAARALFDRLAAAHYDPEWWRLAFLDDVVVGLVVPQRIGERGQVGYVGVVSSYQGEGLGHELLDEALRVLAAASLMEVVIEAPRAPPGWSAATS